jgi:hypothetical protein
MTWEATSLAPLRETQLWEIHRWWARSS